MRCKEERIASSIVARSQIVKTCHMNGGACDFHIDESVFVQDGGYSYQNLEGDVAGFVDDVNRELSPFGLQCDCSLVKFRVNHDLLVFSYDQTATVADEAMKEKIRTNEWILEE